MINPAMAVGFLRNRNQTSPAKVLFFPHIFSRSSLVAVSYTHLDVYKRQASAKCVHDNTYKEIPYGTDRSQSILKTQECQHHRPDLSH